MNNMNNIDFTPQIATLLATHPNDNIWGLQKTHEVAGILCDSYSDTFKEVHGFRPRHNITVSEVIEVLPILQKEIENLWNQEQIENNTTLQGILFEGHPVKKGDWDDPEKYWNLD